MGIALTLMMVSMLGSGDPWTVMKQSHGKGSVGKMETGGLSWIDHGIRSDIKSVEDENQRGSDEAQPHVRDKG